MIIFNTWQFNIAAFLVGVVIFFHYYKRAVRNAEKEGAATVLLQIIASITLLTLIPFFPFKLPYDIKPYAFLVVACVFYALNDRLQTTSRKHLEVSVFSILNQLKTVFLILLGVLFFHEVLSLSRILGAALILSGVLFLLYKRGAFELNRYVWTGICATIFFTIAITVDIDISKQFNLPFYMLLTYVIPMALIAFSDRVVPGEIAHMWKGASGKDFLIAGIAWALISFFGLRAFQLGEVTVIAPLQATSVLLNVLFEHWWGERGNLGKKIGAAVLVVAGVYFTVH